MRYLYDNTRKYTMGKLAVTKYFYAIGICLLAACRQEQIETYNGPAAINLFVQEKSKLSNESQLPLGFLDDTIRDSTVYLVANIQGTLVDYPRTIKLQVPDSLSEYDGVNFSIAKETVLPAGETSVKIPLTVKRTGLNQYGNGLRIVVQISESNDFIGGVYRYVAVVATDDMPSQWVGYTHWVGTYLGVCTKTKYRFVYSTLGFYDFTTIGSDYNALAVYKKYLNNKLDEYEQIHGVRLWDPDLNKNVSFP